MSSLVAGATSARALQPRWHGRRLVADRCPELRSRQIEHVLQPRAAQVGSPEVGAAEVGQSEIDAAEIGADQVGAAQVGRAADRRSAGRGRSGRRPRDRSPEARRGPARRPGRAGESTSSTAMRPVLQRAGRRNRLAAQRLRPGERRRPRPGTRAARGAAASPRTPRTAPASASLRGAPRAGRRRSSHTPRSRESPIRGADAWIVQRSSAARFGQTTPAGLSIAKSADAVKDGATQHSATQSPQSARSLSRSSHVVMARV